MTTIYPYHQVRGRKPSQRWGLQLGLTWKKNLHQSLRNRSWYLAFSLPLRRGTENIGGDESSGLVCVEFLLLQTIVLVAMNQVVFVCGIFTMNFTVFNEESSGPLLSWEITSVHFMGRKKVPPKRKVLLMLWTWRKWTTFVVSPAIPTRTLCQCIRILRWFY